MGKEFAFPEAFAQSVLGESDSIRIKKILHLDLVVHHLAILIW